MIRLNHLVDTYSNCYQVNALTRLPGSQVIQAYIDKTCQSNSSWALLQIDINHFGAYNKIFGYDEGDTVLKSVADLLRLIILRDDPEPVFLGHEGRDDFTAIIRPERVNEVCNEILSRFEKQSANFYPAEHREASHQIWIDRQGNARVEQPIGLSIGVVTDGLCDSLSYLELKEAAESVLNRAKMERQSGVFTNRRHLVGKLAQMRRGNQSSQRPA
jgi:diguanylate cyclase (GGDEF)-like protein